MTPKKNCSFEWSARFQAQFAEAPPRVRAAVRRILETIESETAYTPPFFKAAAFKYKTLTDYPLAYLDNVIVVYLPLADYPIVRIITTTWVDE